MRKLFIVACLVSCIKIAAQSSSSDSGTFLIHKFEQHIGREKYTVTKNANTLKYNIDFAYTDRGSPVTLKAMLQLNPNLQPLAFTIKGGTSRFSSVNDSVVINNKTVEMRIDDSSFNEPLQQNSFTIAGYSPATAQMLLIQYWKKHDKPANIHTIPFGSVQVRIDGLDTFSFNHNSLILERYVITGLIWGNELLWADKNGQLYCLITNDAEGDKQEMMLDAYESLLPTFIDKAAIDGMRLFINTAKPSSQKHDVIAIKGGTIIDVVNKTSIPGGVVVIENGMIKSVGTANTVNIPSDAFVIDAAGKAILPGLWDMHSHFEQAEWGPAYLAAGVTTVRDCGNEFGYINSIQKAIDDGHGIGPHILKAGIIDGKGPYALGIIQADTKQQAVEAVQRYNENGFVQIKIYSSMKPEIVKAVCDEAHRLGLTVTGHIPGGMTLQQGVDSGMDMVNHVQYVGSVMKPNKADSLIYFDDSTNKGVLEFIKTHHVVIDPTLGVYELVFRPLKNSITSIEPAFSTLPAPLQKIFVNTGMEDERYLRYGSILMKNYKAIVKAMYDDGVPIVAGTDMDFPGYSVDRELELYVESGLTPMQAIETATIIPATVMKQANITGSIETAKRADILIIDGDPLQDIRNLRKVVTIIKDGNIYDPLQLHKIAGFNVK